jgi:hypothetical protein
MPLRQATLKSFQPDKLHALPPLPSVVTELHLGSPHLRLRRSCVATLLAEVTAGMDSDATMDDVVRRVVDFGKEQELIDCSVMDGCGLWETLERDYGIGRWPEDRPRPLDNDSAFPKWRCECFLPVLREALDADAWGTWDASHDAGQPDGEWYHRTSTRIAEELIALAKVAVHDIDKPSFRAIIRRVRQLSIHVDAWSVVDAIGECVGTDALCREEAVDVYLSRLAGVADWSTSFVNHDARVFEMLLPHLIELDQPAKTAEFLRAYPDAAPCALASEWRPGPRTAYLARCSLAYMRGAADWKLIGEFLADASKRVRCSEFLANVSDLAKLAPPPEWSPNQATVDKAEGLAWCVAAVVWRARCKRLLELYFLDWLEASDVYKPIAEDGEIKAPKRLRDEFESVALLRGRDVRLS